MNLLTNPYSFDEIDPEKIKPDIHGRVKVRAKIMTTGKLKYIGPDGKPWIANVRLEDLEKARSTLAYKPVTIKHPPALLDGASVTAYQEGVSADNGAIEEIDGKQWLVSDLILQSDRAINTAKEGKLGVSAGYYRKALPANGNEFDFSDIDINHIAIGCLNPRAEGAEIYSLDDAESEAGMLYPAKQQNPTKEVKQMKQTLNAVEVGAFSLDEAQIDYEEGSEGAVKTFQNREKKLVKQIKDLQVSMDDKEQEHKEKFGEVSGDLKVKNAKIEELEKKLEDSVSMDDVGEYADNLSKVREEAKFWGIKDEVKDIGEGMRLVCETARPGISFDDEEIPGAYKGIVSDKKQTKKKIESDKALANASSMDDKTKVSFSQLDIGMLRKSKKLMERRKS